MVVVKMSDNLFLEVQPEVFKQVPRLKDGFLLTLMMALINFLQQRDAV